MQTLNKKCKYYAISPTNPRVSTIACSPESTGRLYDIFPLLKGKDELPFEFTLYKCTITKKGLVDSLDLTGIDHIWLDCFSPGVGCLLFSERLKGIIVDHLTGKEGLDWMVARVNSSEEQRNYYVPRFAAMLDVLDVEASKFGGLFSNLIGPVFAWSKVQNYSVFPDPVYITNKFPKPEGPEFWSIPSTMYVSEAIKKAVLAAKLPGITFPKYPVR